MEFKSSLSWFDPKTSVRKFQAIPFVSRAGKFSIHTLYVWKAYPQQVLFSLISTVYSRIRRILTKRKFVNRRILNCAFKVSVVYVLTRSAIIDRFLGMSRLGGTPMKLIEKFTHYSVHELDADKRFVYSQAYLQANWLKFRVFRPSDKSRVNMHVGTHLRNLGFGDEYQVQTEYISVAFQRSSDLWQVTPYRSSRAKVARKVVRPSSVASACSSDRIIFNRTPEEFTLSSDEDW